LRSLHAATIAAMQLGGADEIYLTIFWQGLMNCLIAPNVD
jgi:hypothetical protein